jgi:hypothetical protein
MLLYVDQAGLPPFWKWIARAGPPIAAILIPAAFFLSVASPTATEPNGLMNLAYVGAIFLAAAVISLGVGLIRQPPERLNVSRWNRNKGPTSANIWQPSGRSTPQQSIKQQSARSEP